MKKWSILLLIAFLLLLISGCYLLNIDYIEEETGNIKKVGEKKLLLNKNYEKIEIPHCNIKGNVKEIKDDIIIIELSENSRSFLDTNEIAIYNNVELNKNDKIFIEFKNIEIEKNILEYDTISIYKYNKDIKMIDIKNNKLLCKNDYGGFLKIEGKSFSYNNDRYFESDIELTSSDQKYYINIENGKLLIEQYKSLIFPFRIYNMINYQETHFNKIIEIYRGKNEKQDCISNNI